MKSNQLKNLRSKSVSDLKKEALEKKRELVKTYTKTKVGQEKNLKKARLLRRDIAQILAIITDLGSKKETK